jgi:MFS family permease
MSFLSLFIQATTGGFTFGIFLAAMNEELGWSRSTIVLATSLLSITAAVASPLLGRIVDRRGPRLVLILSVIGMGIAQAASGLVTDPWQFYLAFGLLGGVARATLQSVAPGAMIAQWFQRRRSSAYGVAAMGPPLCNLLVPPVIAVVVATLGWRAGWMALGVLALALGLAPAVLIRRRRPEDIGLRIDNDPPEELTPGEERKPVGPASGSEDWTAREAIHHPAFWMIAAGMSLILLAPNISIIFMFSYLTSQGLPPTVAAATLSAVSAMQVVSRLVFWAPAIRRIGSVRWALVLWGSLLLASSLLLAVARGEVWAYVAAAVLGLGLGGNLVLQLQVWPEYFGRLAIGTIIGTAQLVQGVTSATVPLLLAALLDRTGSYTTVYLIVAALVFVGLLLHLVVGRPRRPAPVIA